MGVVLDASALLAVLNKEKGAEQVSRRLASAMLSTVNLTEVATYLMGRGMDAKDMRAMLDEMVAEIVDYDEDMAYAAAELNHHTRKYGLSLGDRACLALARLRGLPVLTADRVWAELSVDGITIELIR